MRIGYLKISLLILLLLSFHYDIVKGTSITHIKADSTYFLKNHINLRGRTVVLPENVTVVVKVGSISNGTLIGNNTVIKCGKDLIFKENIDLQGTFEADTAFSAWFGIKNDCRVDTKGRYLSGTDNYQAFKNLFLFKNVSISEGSYMLSGRIECQNGQVINGNGSTLKFYHKGVCILVDGYPISDVSLNNLHIIGSKYDYNDITEYWHGVSINYAEGVRLNNIVVESCRGDGIYIGGTQANGGDNCIPKSITLSNVKARSNHRQGLSITRCDHVLAEDCEFSTTFGTLPYCGVDIEPNYNLKEVWFNECRNIRFVRCKFCDNDSFGLMICGRGMTSDEMQAQIQTVVVENCSFVNNGICVYGVKGLKIEDCVLQNGGILMTAHGRIQDVFIEDVSVVYDGVNNSCGFQMVLLEQECADVSLSNFRASNCGIFGVYVTRGNKKDRHGNPLPLLNGLTLSNIYVANCSNAVFVSEYVKNAVYDGIVIKDNGVDRNGVKMKSRYGNNLGFIQLDDEKSRRVIIE